MGNHKVRWNAISDNEKQAASGEYIVELVLEGRDSGKLYREYQKIMTLPIFLREVGNQEIPAYAGMT